MFNFLTNLNLAILQTPLNQFLFQATIITFSSFIICFFAIKYFLKIADKKQLFYQPIRSDGPQSHLKTKAKTPTMGGLMIVLAVLITSILFINISNSYILITLFIFTSFATIGFIDDFIKVNSKNSKGFAGSVKIVIQFIIVGIALLWLQITNGIYLDNVISIPFSSLTIDIGILYILFAVVVVVGTANAVNLTDGLDGLVSVPVIINLICLAVIIYLVSDYRIAYKLNINNIVNIRNISELIMFCLALIGAILAFLKFNLKPAKIFMGDVGSLAIGAVLGMIAIIVKQELIFAIISLLFVVEALSVILQVGSYKLRKKRIFLMAPLHHHFEKKGWKEKKIVRVFWLSALIFAFIGLAGLIVGV